MNRKVSILVLIAILLSAVSCAACRNTTSKAEVILEGNATTGYMWSGIPDNSGVYEISEEEYTPDASKPGVVGAGGYYKAVLIPVKPGNGSVKFIYKRSWEDKPIKEVIYSVNVDEDMNITLSEK